MNILVFGASGRTGHELVMQALALGHHVTAVVRSPAKYAITYERLRVTVGDALDPASFGAALDGQDMVVSALGVASFSASIKPMTFHAETAHNIMSEMMKLGVRKYVGITSVGVLDEPTTPIWYRMIVKPLLRHKYSDMRDMEKIIADSELDWTIVRPTRLINGPLTQHYRVGMEGDIDGGSSIVRADVADFILRKTGESAYSHRAVAISN